MHITNQQGQQGSVFHPTDVAKLSSLLVRLAVGEAERVHPSLVTSNILGSHTAGDAP